jgi:hypothetical protein
MQIKTITVSYEYRQNLGDYSSVNPKITVTADLEEGDDPDIIQLRLLDEARGLVQNEIDNALEVNNQPAKFSPEPRYDLIEAGEFLAILPAGMQFPIEGYRYHKKW